MVCSSRLLLLCWMLEGTIALVTPTAWKVRSPTLLQSSSSSSPFDSFDKTKSRRSSHRNQNYSPRDDTASSDKNDNFWFNRSQSLQKSIQQEQQRNTHTADRKQHNTNPPRFPRKTPSTAAAAQEGRRDAAGQQNQRSYLYYEGRQPTTTTTTAGAAARTDPERGSRQEHSSLNLSRNEGNANYHRDDAGRVVPPPDNFYQTYNRNQKQRNDQDGDRLYENYNRNQKYNSHDDAYLQDRRNSMGSGRSGTGSIRNLGNENDGYGDNFSQSYNRNQHYARNNGNPNFRNRRSGPFGGSNYQSQRQSFPQSYRENHAQQQRRNAQQQHDRNYNTNFQSRNSARQEQWESFVGTQSNSFGRNSNLQQRYNQSGPPPPYQQRPDRLHGGSQRSYPVRDPLRDTREVVTLQTDGMPLMAQCNMWEGPNHAPQTASVWSEDGRARPFRTVHTRGPSVQQASYGGTVNIRNEGSMAFPITADVETIPPRSIEEKVQRDSRIANESSSSARQRSAPTSRPRSARKTIQGDGSLEYFPIDPSVGSVEITLESEGLPVMALIEIMQGPGQARQVAEVYTQDGLNRPFTAIVETPGYGSTILIRNTAPMVYPLTASVDVHTLEDPRSSSHSGMMGQFQAPYMVMGGGGR